MSDFSELCPLFDTGVFQEITFPDIRMTGVTACGNVFLGTLTAAAATKPGIFTFGRTVIVTDAFIKTRTKPTAAMNLKLYHFTSQLAAGTEIGTLAVSITASTVEIYTWVPMTVTDATFTSSEVLGLTMGTGTASGAGTYDLILRYKEA